MLWRRAGPASASANAMSAKADESLWSGQTMVQVLTGAFPTSYR